MKTYKVKSYESVGYFKIVEAKNEKDAHKKAYTHDPDNKWEQLDNCSEVQDYEIEEQ